MKPIYWKLFGLAEVGIVTAYYHLFSGAGISAASFPYLVEVNGLLYLNLTIRVFGYLVIVALTLLILFADKLQFTQKGERSEYCTKGE